MKQIIVKFLVASFFWGSYFIYSGPKKIERWEKTCSYSDCEIYTKKELQLDGHYIKINGVRREGEDHVTRLAPVRCSSEDCLRREHAEDSEFLLEQRVERAKKMDLVSAPRNRQEYLHQKAINEQEIHHQEMKMQAIQALTADSDDDSDNGTVEV